MRFKPPQVSLTNFATASMQSQRESSLVAYIVFVSEKKTREGFRFSLRKKKKKRKIKVIEVREFDFEC